MPDLSIFHPIRTMDPEWFTILGLSFDVMGAILLIAGFSRSKKKAREMATLWYQGRPLELSLLKQSGKPIIGFVLLAIGFGIQIYGNWPR